MSRATGTRRGASCVGSLERGGSARLVSCCAAPGSARALRALLCACVEPGCAAVSHPSLHLKA
eukprot:148403-Chlamydomonas_euryale.AAC.2